MPVLLMLWLFIFPLSGFRESASDQEPEPERVPEAPWPSKEGRRRALGLPEALGAGLAMELSTRLIRRLDDFGGIADTRTMNTLETDIEVSADGSMKLLSPLPEWLKPGRVHVVLTVPNGTSPKAKRVIPTATPEMLAKRAAAFEAVRKLNPYRDIIDPV